MKLSNCFLALEWDGPCKRMCNMERSKHVWEKEDTRGRKDTGENKVKAWLK